MASKIKSNVVSAFKMHGLTLRSDASRYLVEVLTPVQALEREPWLDKIIEIIQKQTLSSSMVNKAACELAIHECKSEQVDDSDSIFNVIDAFSVPRYSYVKDRKKFISDSNLGKESPHLHGKPSDKASMFLDRYTILHQRTLRHHLFTPPALGADPNANNNKFQLKPVEYLVGSTAKLQGVLVLGMLIQLKEGKWYLEDPTGSVALDFANANFQPGLFTENSFVLAEGCYEDGIFHIEAFGLPPPEKAENTRSYFGNINFFGGPSRLQVKASTHLAKVEQEKTDAMFVLLSDVWLDNKQVMNRLDVLFKGYSTLPPYAFVFCGNFISQPKVLSHANSLKECFKKLANILSGYPEIVKSSQIIFVPGPNDPGHSTILPRPAIPNSITEVFRKKIPNAIFTSNPCRIQYCTQEIVVFREDIVTKMCRNCVKFPADGNVPVHFAKSIISQGHLCPLPLHVSPMYWAYDCGLRIYPLPDVLVTADKYDPFDTTTMSSTVINPGSFLRTNFNFKVYYPATKEVQNCRAPEQFLNPSQSETQESDTNQSQTLDLSSSQLIEDSEPINMENSMPDNDDNDSELMAFTETETLSMEDSIPQDSVE